MTTWRRSTHCEAGACIEVAGPWRSASACGGGSCLEARRPEPGMVLVRDSKLGDRSPVLAFDAAAWVAFVNGLKAGSVTA